MHSHSIPEKSSLLRAGQVVGSVVAAESLALAASPQVADLCDIVEFRADALASEPAAVARAMDACPLPALLTVRDPEEGGFGDLSPQTRHTLFSQLLPHASLLDLEMRNLEAFPGLLEDARRHGIPVIASFHDFKGTPDLDWLLSRIYAAKAAGVDAVKLATTTHGHLELGVLSALQEIAVLPMATMGMGTLGRVSRLLLASLGSVLNYGYLDQPTVPGQWPAQRLRAIIRELRGEEPGPPPPHT
jgi:3-dehydroquinate dehydratase I